MTMLLRLSPVSFPIPVLKTERSEGWEIILEYEGETLGPFITDLSYSARWDLQSADLSNTSWQGCRIPDNPGKCAVSAKTLIYRMNATQATVVTLCDPSRSAPEDAAFTDTTEASALLAVFGPDTFGIMEKVSALDFTAGDYRPPRLFQGPIVHIPCQAVVLEKNRQNGCVLVSCARGYGAEMAGALLEAGQTFGLRPGGEGTFLKAYGQLSGLSESIGS